MSGRRTASVVNLERLRQELSWALDELELELGGREVALERVAVDADTSPRRLRALLAGESCSVYYADRVLDAIGYRDGPRRHPETGRLLPLVVRSAFVVDGRRRQPGETGRVRRRRVDSRLTVEQVRAAHRLHVEGGLSLRELSRRGFEAWGYSSPQSALNCLVDALELAGLPTRSQGAATAKANRERPGVRKPAHLTKNEFRRLERAMLREVDPEFRRQERERLDALHEAERARGGRSRETTSAVLVGGAT